MDDLVCPACSSKNIRRSLQDRPSWGYNEDSLIWWECNECSLHFAQGDWWPEEHVKLEEE